MGSRAGVGMGRTLAPAAIASPDPRRPRVEEHEPMSDGQTRNRATSDPKDRKDVLERMRQDNVEFLLLWFTDIEGHLKSFAVTPSEMEGALDDGMGFDGSSITGFNAIEESDMVAIPDPLTYQLMPAT